jgi:hypothetical protein
LNKLLLISIINCLLSIVNLANAQWSAPVQLSTMSVGASLNENMTSCLAVRGDTVHVVWCDHRPAGNSIWYKRSIDDGLSWNTEVAITDTTGHAQWPTVAVSGAYVHVGWMETLPTGNASFYIRSADGGNTWGNPYCLDSATKFWPGIAADANNVVLSLNKELVVGNTEVYYINSVDNGTTWNPEQRVSFATDRSEDPSINVLGNDVHLSWNDKRSGIMQIYYRHSPDLGFSWGPETQLSIATGTQTCYTSMVCLDDTNVDVPYGYNITGNFDVWLSQSHDVGSTVAANHSIAGTSLGEIYPYMCRDGQKLHVVYAAAGPGTQYIYSADGGNSWTPPYNIAHGMGYIKYNDCTLHFINQDSSKIWYRRNPTGNCIIAGVGENTAAAFGNIHVYPNPFHSSALLALPFSNGELKIYNSLGAVVKEMTVRRDAMHGVSTDITINRDGMADGLYFIKASSNDGEWVGKIIIE